LTKIPELGLPPLKPVPVSPAASNVPLVPGVEMAVKEELQSGSLAVPNALKASTPVTLSGALNAKPVIRGSVPNMPLLVIVMSITARAES